MARANSFGRYENARFQFSKKVIVSPQYYLKFAMVLYALLTSYNIFSIHNLVWFHIQMYLVVCMTSSHWKNKKEYRI